MDQFFGHQKLCVYLLSSATCINRDGIPLTSFSPIPLGCLDFFVGCLCLCEKKLINKCKYHQQIMLIDLTRSDISFIYNKNGKGPRTVPWGTPDRTVKHPKMFLILQHAVFNFVRSLISIYECCLINSIMIKL